MQAYLLPTDGSSLSGAAARERIALAKSLGARPTAITVFPTFDSFALEPIMMADTPEQYETECRTIGAKYLKTVEAAAGLAGVPNEGLLVHLPTTNPERARPHWRTP